MSTEEANEKAVKEVLERWSKAETSLMEDRRNYWLNFAFIMGQQWVWWDSQRGMVRTLPEMTVDNQRVRVTINKISSRTSVLMGKLLQRNLAFEVQPSAADDGTMQGARLGENVLEAKRIEQDWEATRTENLFNTLLGGTAAVAVHWNPDAAPIWQNKGTEKIMDSGDVSLCCHSLAEFTVEPGSRTFGESRYWISATATPPKQAKEHYKLNWEPKPDASGIYSPLQRHLMSSRGFDNTIDMCVVYKMYERPEGKNPGRTITVINDKVVEQTDWPFPFEHLNLYVFRQQLIPMRWTGNTIMNAARPVQVLYNSIRSNIGEHAKLAGNARLAVARGSLDDTADLTDEPGEIIEYWADAGGPPMYVAPPQLPRWLTQEADKLEMELDDIMHTQAVSRGASIGDRASGLALSILAEKNDTPLGLMARDQSAGWGWIASLVLRMYASNVKEKRKAFVDIGDGIPQEIEWDGSLLRGQTNVVVPLETTMPTTRTATLAMLTDVKAQFPEAFVNVDAAGLSRLLDLPGAKMIGNAIDQDAGKAIRENHLMSAGEVPMPEKWHNHAKHIAEHNRFRNSSAYETLPIDIKKLIATHVEAHGRLQEEEIAEQAQLNAIKPGLAGMPQPNNPIGSAIPQPFAEAMAGMMPQGSEAA